MKKGFTLIEMLVSMVIFSFIIALAAYSFRFYAYITKKIVMPYPDEAVRFSRLEDVVKSMFYFVCETNNGIGKKQFYIYFHGDSKSMDFITAKPVNIVDNIAVCRLYLDNNTLILKESPVYSKYNNYKEPSLIKEVEKTFTIMNNVSDFKLTYFKDNKKTHYLDKKIPQLVEIQIKWKNKQMTFYFKIMSNFEKKKYFMDLFYAPF